MGLRLVAINPRACRAFWRSATPDRFTRRLHLLFVPRDEVAPRYREYLRLWRQAGHQQKPNIGYWTLVYVDDTDEQAIRKATPHILHAFGAVFGFGDAGGTTVENLVATYERRGEHGAAEIA